MLEFSIEGRLRNGRGRAGRIETPHGSIQTPAFIPVGTKATVKSLTPEMVNDQVGAQAVLANTYHLYLQPGPGIVKKAGGLGKFMNWPGPTFTDSGGFQAFSLQGGLDERRSKFIPGTDGEIKSPDALDPAGSAILDAFAPAKCPSTSISPSVPTSSPLAKVDDDGVTFRSVIDGSTHRFTPEKSIEIQHDLGADIIFALDECAPPGADYESQRRAVDRTSAWARRGLEWHRAHPSGGGSLFGIVQGGKHEDLRRKSAKEIGALDFDGFGLGGTFERWDMDTAVGWMCEELPEGKPRHLLGIGEPADLILGIENGADTFDCVAPTRLGRNGTAYSRSEGRLNLFNARFTDDFGPLDADCGCYSCKNYSRAYIAHLFRAKEMLAATLVSVHNLRFIVDLVKGAREAIIKGSFEEYKQRAMAFRSPSA